MDWSFQDDPGRWEAMVAGARDWMLDWYEGLDRAGRDAVDQTLHAGAGFGIAALGSSWAAWAWAHRREFVVQAPIERIEDTQRDMRFMLYGAGVGQVVFTAWTAAVAVWVGRLLGG
jgi:hypothetical protein